MPTRAVLALLLAALLLTAASDACCPAPPRSGKPVVNADQTIIILWDAATKTQHFIRKASFKSDADDFGFIVPSPSQPELSESGNEAFPILQKFTEPEKVKKKKPAGGVGCGCSARNMAPGSANALSVRVLEEKLVAGFNAKVLEADTADALVDWLKTNDYAYSPEVAAWAAPYIERKWKFTALRVAAKTKEEKAANTVTAAALRMSFQTDQPLFPYREPDPTRMAADLGAKNRLLRIYFIGETRYQGEFAAGKAWSGTVAWAGKLTAAQRKSVLDELRLPDTTGPANWCLTEFEDRWPYALAPSDVTFRPSATQGEVRREPIVEYTRGPSPWLADITVYAIALALFGPVVWRRLR